MESISGNTQPRLQLGLANLSRIHVLAVEHFSILSWCVDPASAGLFYPSAPAHVRNFDLLRRSRNVSRNVLGVPVDRRRYLISVTNRSSQEKD